MSKVYRTARGKNIDMDKVKLANETVTAVGNMKVNARGDRLGVGGQVVAGRNKIMDQVYAVNQAAVAGTGGYSPNDPDVYAQQQALIESNRAKELHDLASNLVNNSSIETPAPLPSTNPAPRGSLAGSVAKPAVVKQELLPDPKKSNGPTRI